MRVSSQLLQPTERKIGKECTEARDVELVEGRKEGPGVCAIARSGQITWSDLSGAAGVDLYFSGQPTGVWEIGVTRQSVLCLTGSDACPSAKLREMDLGTDRSGSCFRWQGDGHGRNMTIGERRNT